MTLVRGEQDSTNFVLLLLDLRLKVEYHVQQQHEVHVQYHCPRPAAQQQ